MIHAHIREEGESFDHTFKTKKVVEVFKSLVKEFGSCKAAGVSNNKVYYQFQKASVVLSGDLRQKFGYNTLKENK